MQAASAIDPASSTTTPTRTAPVYHATRALAAFAGRGTMAGMSADCPKCGAPQQQGYVICSFCKNAYSEEALRSAIPCPQCRELSAWGNMKCVRCHVWLVVQCLFCANVSPYTVPACLSCNEAFQGMAQRKAARDAEIVRQQEIAASQRRVQAVATYGHVGASFLGSVAGAMLSSSMHSHSHSHSHWSSQSESVAESVVESSDDGGGSSFLGSVFEAASSDDGGGGSWFD
jgi:hypothetical protein